MPSLDPGIHLLHKPAGPTSFSLVQPFLSEARGLRPRIAVCHGGALDPFAEGLLPILVGRGDASGLDPARLDGALAPFLGWHEQVPPATSNKRVGGERAYVRAHRGELVELPPVRVYLHEARWVWHDLPRASGLRLVARGGYYVRALARDLGRALGCRAHLSRLSRTAIGPWRDPGPGRNELVRGSRILPWGAVRDIGAEEARALRNGPIVRGELRPPEWLLPQGFPDPQAPVRALLDGQLIGLLRERDGMLWREMDLRGIRPAPGYPLPAAKSP